MTDFFIRLTNVDFDGDGSADTIEYHFALIQNLDSNGEIDFATIEADIPERNQLMGFSGKRKEFPIVWLAHDDGTDRSSGTFASSGISDARISGGTIVTLDEQQIFLEDYLHNSTLGASWRLFGGRFSDPDGDGVDEGTPVAIQRLNISRNAPQVNRARSVMMLKVGEVV